jgi:hypothetical protein
VVVVVEEAVDVTPRIVPLPSKTNRPIPGSVPNMLCEVLASPPELLNVGVLVEVLPVVVPLELVLVALRF